MSVSKILVLSFFAAIGAAGFSHAQDSSTTDAALADGVLASVNGRPIPQMSVENVAQQLTAAGETADRAQILEELINLEVLTQAAEEMELDKNPEVSAALQLQYTQTMANAYLARRGADMTFSEEELKAEYESQSESVDRAEFRASHILLDNEDTAREVLAELAAGKKFDALAKLHSIDPAGDNGGDLGWFQSSTLPPEFTSAVAQMQVGETSMEPVQTEFGYHIIKLVDKRNTALPDFESVKSGLTNLAVRKALAQHVEDLRAAAQITTR